MRASPKLGGGGAGVISPVADIVGPWSPRCHACQVLAAPWMRPRRAPNPGSMAAPVRTMASPRVGGRGAACCPVPVGSRGAGGCADAGGEGRRTGGGASAGVQCVPTGATGGIVNIGAGGFVAVATGIAGAGGGGVAGTGGCVGVSVGGTTMADAGADAGGNGMACCAPGAGVSTHLGVTEGTGGGLTGPVSGTGAGAGVWSGRGMACWAPGLGVSTQWGVSVGGGRGNPVRQSASMGGPSAATPVASGVFVTGKGMACWAPRLGVSTL